MTGGLLKYRMVTNCNRFLLYRYEVIAAIKYRRKERLTQPLYYCVLLVLKQ
jgi:hypothetical protein